MGVGTAKAGKDFLLKMGDGGSPTETFTTIGGLRGATLKMGTEIIDVTDIASNQWRTVLDGAGIRSMTISGNGVFTNDAIEQRLRSHFLSQSLTNFQIIDADGNYWQGAFKIKDLEFAGDYKSEEKYTLALESSGAIAFTSGP